MRLQSPVVRLAAACGLGLAVTSVLYFTMQSNSVLQQPAQAAPRASMLVLKHHVGALTKLTADDLVAKKVPADMVPAGAIAEQGVALNRYTRQECFPDEPVLEAKLFAAGQEPTVLPLPVGKRAVTVAVNEVVGVAGFISVGSRVDVVATMEVNQKSISRIIMQDIQVLAAAQNPKKDDDPQAKVVSSVTLAVSPEQAEELTLATDKGTIRLAMRSPLEQDKVKTSGVTASSLVDGQAPVVASAPHSAPAPVRTVTRTVVKTVERPVHVEPQDPGIMVIRGTDTTFVKR